MTNKKAAVELSFNFLVVLIISIVLFGFGVIFIRNLFSQATNIRDSTLEELDDRIADLICEGIDRVCIPIESKTIRRKEFDVFGMGVSNILDTTEKFVITISTPKDNFGPLLGYTKGGAEIRESEVFKGLVMITPTRTISIKQNEEAKIGIGIQVPKEAVSGRYIFNADVTKEGGGPYSNTLKFYVEVP